MDTKLNLDDFVEWFLAQNLACKLKLTYKIGVGLYTFNHSTAMI